MTFYFIRHGETYANREKRFAGITDVPLSPLGEEQALEVGEKLKHIKIDAVYTSDLLRAKCTAKAIVKHHDVAMVETSELREMNFGIWEGKTFEEIKKEMPEKLDEWFKTFEKFDVPGGESVLDMYTRVVAFYEQILETHHSGGDSTVVIVAHGGVIQALLSYLMFKDLSGYWRFSVQNCGVNKIEYVMGMPVIKGINQ